MWAQEHGRDKVTSTMKLKPDAVKLRLSCTHSRPIRGNVRVILGYMRIMENKMETTMYFGIMDLPNINIPYPLW